MEPRQLVAARGLVPATATALAGSAFAALPFERLGPVKTLLKQFFSPEPWSAADETALAIAVGPGAGWWREPLADDLALEYGWTSGHFELRVDVVGAVPEPAASAAADPSLPDPGVEDDVLATTFDSPIVPEVTPNPRTLMFRTGPIHRGDSRSYLSGEDADDPRVAGLFSSFPELATVLVARDFVALTLRQAGRWPALVGPVLRALVDRFPGTGAPDGTEPADEPEPGTEQTPASARAARSASAGGTRLDSAWRELGALEMHDPDGLARVLEASRSSDPAERQVAAALLGDAAPAVAAETWNRLLADSSRSVRRSVVDAMVDAGREELRPSLERALDDADAWVRWKAVRGLRELGGVESLAAVGRAADDPDFRVRMEAARARLT